MIKNYLKMWQLIYKKTQYTTKVSQRYISNCACYFNLTVVSKIDRVSLLVFFCWEMPTAFLLLKTFIEDFGWWKPVNCLFLRVCYVLIQSLLWCQFHILIFHFHFGAILFLYFFPCLVTWNLIKIYPAF